MNKIDEIKERVGLRSHMKKLCNAPKLPDSIIGMNYLNAEDDVIYLLHILEIVEIDLTYMKNVKQLTEDYNLMSCVDSALKAIRGN